MIVARKVMRDRGSADVGAIHALMVGTSQNGLSWSSGAPWIARGEFAEIGEGGMAGMVALDWATAVWGRGGSPLSEVLVAGVRCRSWPLPALLYKS